MKIMFEFLSVLFSLNCVYPVLMYYIYDDNPIAGYVSNAIDIGTYPKSRIFGHKKYFTNGNNQKSMKLVNERAVDSHFKISKASPVSFAALPNVEYKYTSNMRKFTEPPLQKNLIDVNSGALQFPKKTVDIQNSDQSKSSFANDVQKHFNEGLFKPNIRNKIENLSVFNEVQNKKMIAPKSHTSVDTKKMNKINIRRPYTQQNYFPRSLANVKDKVLHKANINNEQNAQLMSYMLNEIAQKFLERKSQTEREYRKRDYRDALPNNTVHLNVVNRQENDVDHNNKHISKEIGGINVKNSIKRSRIVAPQTGTYDLGVEMNDMPYALFYRMNHENIEHSNFFTSAQDRTNIEEPMNIQDKHRRSMTYARDNVRGNQRSVNTTDKNYNYTAFRDR